MVNFGVSQARQEPKAVETWTPEQKQLFQALWPQIAAGLGKQYKQVQKPLYRGGEPSPAPGELGAPPEIIGYETTYEEIPGAQTGVPAYPGQMYVPKTPEEEAYLQAVQTQMGAYTGALPTRQAALQQVLSGQVPYQVGPEWAEQYYEQAIKAPALQEWREIAEPAIREAFAGPGYWGTARATEQARGAETLATQLGAQRASLMYQEELARRQAQEAAAQRQLTGLQYPVTPALPAEAQTAATLSRQIEQERVLGDLQRWLAGETVQGVSPIQYNPWIQLAFQALGLSPLAIGTSGSSFGFNFGVAKIG
jgi:hypothetical protein